MSVENVSLTAMIGWFPETGRILKAGWRRFAAAALWTLLVVFLPIALFFGLAFAIGVFKVAPDPVHPFGEHAIAFWIGYGVLMLASLVVQPALTAGWFGICGDVDVGRGGRGRDVFAPFRHRGMWWRSLGVALFTLLAVLLAAVITMGPFIPGFIAFDQAMTLHTANVAAGIPSEAPFPPIGFFLGYFVFFLAMGFLQPVSLLAFAEVAMRPTRALPALVLAARAVLRNFFKLLLVGFLASALLGLAMMVVILPVALLAAGLAFISPVLTFVVIGIFYLALIMAMYPTMFVFLYVMWKGLLTAAPAAGAAVLDA